MPSSGTGIYWRQRGLLTNWDRRKGLRVPPFTSTDTKHFPSVSLYHPELCRLRQASQPLSACIFVVFALSGLMPVLGWGGMQGDNADRGFSTYLGLKQYPYVGA